MAILSSLDKKCKYPDNPLKEDEQEIDISTLTPDELANRQIKELQKLDLAAKAAFGIDEKQDGQA